MYTDQRDPTAFIVAILVLLTLVIGFVVFAKLRARFNRAELEAEEKRRREADAEAKQRLRLGTHVQLGEKIVRRCALCQEPATHGRLMFARNEGWNDFVRRRFGAPPRLKVIEKGGDAVRCESHHHLALGEMRLKLAATERHRVEQERDAEVELGHFERTLEKKLEEIVAKHERELGGRRRKSEAGPAKVLPFQSKTGTDATK